MIRRCEVPTSKHFADYGGRGIAVCRQWRRSFESFLAAVGRKPTPSHSLDRIDNAKGYKPGNVRWATREEQARNRRNNHVVHFRGQSLPVVAWAERTGIKYRTLMARLARGWSPARALEAA